jgi:hypothetical protein
MWWDIIKSTRGEAYAEFVKEFGPEVELDSLQVNPYEDEKQVQIFPDGASEWFITYDILTSGEEQFVFETSKYGQYEDFVEGMFETEYPERYQELLNMAREALPQEEQSTNPERHKIPLHVIKRYLDCAEELQEYLITMVRNEYNDNSIGQRDGLLALVHASIIRGITPAFISQKINSRRYGPDSNLKHVVINTIRVAVVDRTLQHPIIQEFFNFVGSGRAVRLRDQLRLEYYNLYKFGISDTEPSKPRTTTDVRTVTEEMGSIIRRLLRAYRIAFMGREED